MQTLHRCIPLAPDIANNHCHDATSASQNDVHRHGDIVAESEIVEHVHDEEHDDIRKPAF